TRRPSAGTRTSAPAMRSNSSYVITPDAFSVHPALVGRPLARPARRLTAMLLDLLLVSILVHTAGAMLLGLAAAWFAFRAAGRFMGVGTGTMGRMTRLSVRAAGALVLFLLAVNLWSGARETLRSVLRQRVTVATMGTSGPDSVQVSALEAVGIATQVSALQQTHDDAEARRLVGEMATRFRKSGMEDDDIQSTLRDLYDNESEERQEWLGGIVDAAMTPQASTAPAPAAPDSLARAYAAAVEAGDTAAANALRPRVASALARDSLDALRGQLREARQKERASAQALEKVEDRGLLASLLHFLDDLGIGFGWSGLYFTAFVALWNGQTPAKRLLGVRVVRLDGKPMTWWSSFERFGGYAAGLVTGLMGFAQVYWDRNRQMIHDKIVETVVVRERAGAEAVPVQAPAAAAAYARYTDLPRS
ncbi:RDD family protein, partial [Longimicrobium sp.]|uniref:RDD family protein n=1 Tax=Longimicrobium sp. TaxID=2029185 RepID=UPI002E366B6B